MSLFLDFELGPRMLLGHNLGNYKKPCDFIPQDQTNPSSKLFANSIHLLTFEVTGFDLNKK